MKNLKAVRIISPGEELAQLNVWWKQPQYMTVDATTSRKNQRAPSALASELLVAHRERAGCILQCVQGGGEWSKRRIWQNKFSVVFVFSK